MEVARDWEVWRRALEPEATARMKYRHWYLVQRYETRALCQHYIAQELRMFIYAPGDFHIANVVVGIERPPFKLCAPGQVPKNTRPAMPWDSRVRVQKRRARVLGERLKAAQPKKEKPPRIMEIDGHVVVIPQYVSWIEDSYSPGWSYQRTRKRVPETKFFTVRKYGGKLKALQACAEWLSANECAEWPAKGGDDEPAGRRPRRKV